jgi:sortase A
VVRHKRAKTERRNAGRVWAALAIVAGVALVAFAVFFLRDQLPNQVSAVVPTAAGSIPSFSPSATPSPSTTQVVINRAAHYARLPKSGEHIGTVTLPTLGLSWPIFEGTSQKVLAKGVGHYRGSVLPGLQDNTVLSGHRTTVFNRLGELAVSDLVYVKTNAGVFIYRVRSFRVVVRTDRTVIVPTETAVLTLTTCYPFDNIGATTDAFVVTADLVSSQF